MLLASSGVSGASSKTYTDDLFVSYLRTGNGTSQSITTGFQPDLIWTKSRSAATGHRLVDSVRGAGNSLESNSTLAQQSEAAGITAFNSSGYSVGADSDYNTNAVTYVDFVFRKAPKFFDVVTYTGDGAASRAISHSLGQTPGMVIVKNIGAAAGWKVWHRSLPAGVLLELDQTFAAQTQGYFPSAPDATTFTVSATPGGAANATSNTYVAYLFAHDDSADGIIQCGSFTTDGSGNATVNLGWEPQYVLIKKTNSTQDWYVFDEARGFTVSASNDAFLLANTSAAENGAVSWMSKSATGFSASDGAWGASQTYIYLAIRRPNKPPTSGTQVYNADTIGVTTSRSVGFPVDLVMCRTRTGTTSNYVGSRLTGNGAYLQTASTAAEGAFAFKFDGPTNFFSQTSAAVEINHFFRRAPGVFDIVCYTGTGVARTVPHSLGVAPELMIVKARSVARDWTTYVNAIGLTKYLALNLNYGSLTDATIWNNTAPTSTGFSVGNVETNNNGVTYVAYLFATKAGISKVGSYTGNGSSQTIDCGFSTGVRFVMVKRADSTGDWYVWDSTRGIVAGNDPHLSLNTTAAEVTTDDSVDPDAAGIVVNQVAATNINVNGASYIYLAYA